MNADEVIAALQGLQADLTMGANHVYRLRGKHVPNVSTIGDEWHKDKLERWKIRVQREADIRTAWKVLGLTSFDDEAAFAAFFEQEAGDEYEHQKQAREAADVGKQVHAMIEDHIKKKLGIPSEAAKALQVGDEAISLFDSWLRWEREHEFTPLGIELRVLHEPLWYCGTVDLLARVEDQHSVLDWKTKKLKTKRPWPDELVQNIAYRKALESMGLGEWIGHIVVIPKDGSAVVAHRSDPDADALAWDAFQACRRLYDIRTRL